MLTVSSPDQMNQQQHEVQKLNQQLLEQQAELAVLRGTLDNKEKVRLNFYNEQ